MIFFSGKWKHLLGRNQMIWGQNGHTTALLVANLNVGHMVKCPKLTMVNIYGGFYVSVFRNPLYITL